MTDLDLADAVRAHANKNYEHDGWDYVVECWDNHELRDVIGTAATLPQAIDNVLAVTRLLNAQREDARGEIF